MARTATSPPRIPLFRHLSAARAARILAIAKARRYRKGQTLFRQGERADAVWIVLDGWVHLVRADHPSDRAHAVVLFTITPREVLCGVSAIEPGSYTASGVAGADSRALRIPAAVFHDALTHEPAFAYQVLRLCAERIRRVAEQYGVMAEPVSKRVVRTLLRLQQQFGHTLPVTHRELAQMSWTTTESAIRAVRKLKRHGYVHGTRGRLTIRKLKALTGLLAASNGAGG